jgi:GT2 family glycosyltransferase
MTTPSEPTVSLVIPNWNTRGLLDELLASVQNTTQRQRCETIVVDNGSADGSPEMVAMRYPWARLIRNPENRGYAGGNNQGIAAARGTYVLLLGSDTVLRNGTVSTLVRFLDEHPKVGAASCRLLNPDLTPQASCKRFPTLRDGVFTYLSLHQFTQHYNMGDFDFYKTQPVDQPAGTCLLLRRSLLNDLGGFDERYKILYNDVDLCHRIHARGWDIYFVAETDLVHHGSVSTRSAPPGVRMEMYKNILMYYTTHFGWTAYLLLGPVLCARLISTVSGKAVQGRVRQLRLRFGAAS